MSKQTLKPRSEIPVQYTWNAESLYENAQAWENEYNQIIEILPMVSKFQSHLDNSPLTLADAFQAIEDFLGRAGKMYVYASMAYNVDTGNQDAARLYGKAQGLMGQTAAVLAFLDPELLSIGIEKLNGWIEQNPSLSYLRHYFDDLFRKQAHVRTAEVEELLGLLSDPFGGAQTSTQMLTDSDLLFKPATSSTGDEQPLVQGTYDLCLASPDRELRRSAFENYTDTYLAFKNTLATNLTTSIKQNLFKMRARRHNTTLDMALFEKNIPQEVYSNLISVFRKNLPTWHRYWAVRRKALGVEKLHPYDIWAPLTTKNPNIPYEKAVDIICEGLAPLGEDYVKVIRRGCTEQRWVDVYPNAGKFGGAFSAGWKGTSPFIVMSFDDTIFSLSTLAHELGHSMHSYLTWQTQPLIYSQYSLFVAEVASNFHQAMVRAHLLKTTTDRDLQISVIEEAMANFHRYFFIMPTLARFELEVQQRVEHGKGVTADDMINLMTDLFREGYGSEMEIDNERVGITWATFSHLFIDYYVYQYATGISAANTLSRRILAGDQGSAKNYLDFLRTGDSLYPLDALKIAGVDMTSPSAVEEAFVVLAGLVERLEKLIEN